MRRLPTITSQASAIAYHGPNQIRPVAYRRPLEDPIAVRAASHTQGFLMEQAETPLKRT